MTNVLDVIGKMPVSRAGELTMFLVEKNGRNWVVLDGPAPGGEVKAVCIEAKDAPRLIKLLQTAFQVHCSIESHTPHA